MPRHDEPPQHCLMATGPNRNRCHKCLRDEETAIEMGKIPASWREIAPRQVRNLRFIVIISFDRLCDVQAKIAEFEA